MNAKQWSDGGELDEGKLKKGLHVTGSLCLSELLLGRKDSENDVGHPVPLNKWHSHRTHSTTPVLQRMLMILKRTQSGHGVLVMTYLFQITRCWLHHIVEAGTKAFLLVCVHGFELQVIELHVQHDWQLDPAGDEGSDIAIRSEEELPRLGELFFHLSTRPHKGTRRRKMK